MSGPTGSTPSCPDARRGVTTPRRPTLGRRLRWLLFGVVVLVCALLLPGGGTAWAAGVVPVQAPAPAASVEQVLTNLRNWVMGIVGVLATVCFTIGAVRYMAAAGDMGEVEKAKTAFRSAAFGYAIVVLAPLLVSVLSGIVGA